ncbi:MAG: hypothetical protein ACOCXP_02915 [Candidatus Dojkabacteria bacterium]
MIPEIFVGPLGLIDDVGLLMTVAGYYIYDQVKKKEPSKN